ncbi:MAG: septal ring lytic transglycosylase RlpA family protein [Edaphocola sp.]
MRIDFPIRSFALASTMLAAGLNAYAQQASQEQKTGIASFYHNKFEGRKTATGEVFDNGKYTAASNHFKLGTYVKVTNQTNGEVVYVKVNDRMGHPSRMIDLAKVAAHELRFIGRGTANVKIEPVSTEEGKRQILAQRTKDSVSNAQGRL